MNRVVTRLKNRVVSMLWAIWLARMLSAVFAVFALLATFVQPAQAAIPTLERTLLGDIYNQSNGSTSSSFADIGMASDP